MKRETTAGLGRASYAGGSQHGARVLAGLVRARIRTIARVVRTIIGVPDYERYVDHLRRCHPNTHPMTRDEFARQRMEDRYSRPGTRCC